MLSGQHLSWLGPDVHLCINAGTACETANCCCGAVDVCNLTSFSPLQAVASVQSSATAEAGLALGTGVSAILLANYLKRIFDTGAPLCSMSCVN